MSVPSMGVEEELLLVSATGRPLPRSKAVLADAIHLDPGLEVEFELTRAQVELNTPVCETAAELRHHLIRMRAALAAAAAEELARLLAIGVPPSGDSRLLVTSKPRYQLLAAKYGLLAREQAVCGLHVHIDVPDREAAVRASNHVRPWLPALLALTANSPIYLGQDTGFSSWRWMMCMRWPCTGPPPFFESAEHYDALVAMQLAAGSILDEQMIYWDIRPSTHLPTLEIRVSDIPLTVDESVLLATLVRALVMTGLAAGDKGPRVEPEVLRTAYWLAARDGLSGDGFEVVHAEKAPMAKLLDQLASHVGDALEELGEGQLVAELLERQLKEGNGAIKQRKAFRKGDDLVALTEVKP